MNQAEEYAEAYSMEEKPLLKELREETARQLQYDDMLSGSVVGHLLQLLIRMSGAEIVLDIGTFTGYSALHMAYALPPEGQVYTFEANEKYVKIAEPFFDRYKKDGGRADIQLCVGDALDTLEKIRIPSPDLVFLDADKDRYPDYFDLVLPMMLPGGIIVIDNAFLKGGVWSLADAKGFKKHLSADERKAISVHMLNQKIRYDDRVEHVLLTVRDGIHIVRKKGKSGR